MKSTALAFACLLLLAGFTPLTGIELTKGGPEIPGSVFYSGGGGGP